MRDGKYLNLKMVADAIPSKGDLVATMRIDDTSKAAGHQLYHMKTDNIALIHKDKTRTKLTTGYTENISHYSADGMKAV